MVHPSTGAIDACPVVTVRRASLLLADDHTILIEGLVGLLKDRFEVVGTVSDGQALVDAALQLRPDVIVADLAMPGMSGLDAMGRWPRAAKKSTVSTAAAWSVKSRSATSS